MQTWTWRKDEQASLARFVAPSCAAQEVRPLATIDGRTVMTVRDQPDGPRIMAESIYDQLRQLSIVYDIEGYTDEGEYAQRIRTPEQIVGQRGTCLDLALLYAGLLLEQQLRPFVVVLEGHAIVAVKVGNARLRVDGASVERTALLAWVHNGDLLPVECTGFALDDRRRRGGGSATLDFDAACEAAEGALDRELLFFIDVERLQRTRGLRPHPCRSVNWFRVALVALLMLAVVGIFAWQLWPRAGPTPLQASDGRTVAVFPFDPSGDATGKDGETVAEGIATSLRGEFDAIGELSSDINPGWLVAGPADLFANRIELPDTRSSGFDKMLRDMNIDIAIIGTIEEDADSRRYVEIDAWLRTSARGVKELGVVGTLDLVDDVDGTTGSLSGIADKLGPQAEQWFHLLIGMGVVHDATTFDDLNAARNEFVRVRDSDIAGPSDDRVVELSNLLVGGTHLFMDSMLPEAEERARQLNSTLTRSSLDAVVHSELEASHVARAKIGLAQLGIIESGCSVENVDAIDAADELLAQAVADSRGTADDASEIPFRIAAMKGRIAWCRWSAGVADSEPAESALTATIEDYERRADPDARSRVIFHAADAYGLRGLLFGSESTDGAGVDAAYADLYTAKCIARTFSERFWIGQFDLLTDNHPGLAERHPELEGGAECRERT